MESILIYALIALAGFIGGLVVMLWRWVEHNDDHDLDRMSNPLKIKFVLGMFAAVAIVDAAIIYCGYEIIPVDIKKDVLIGLAAFLFSGVMTMVLDEGVTFTAKFAAQKAAKIKDATPDIQQAIGDLCSAVKSLNENVSDIKAENLEMKRRMGLQ